MQLIDQRGRGSRGGPWQLRGWADPAARLAAFAAPRAVSQGTDALCFHVPGRTGSPSQGAPSVRAGFGRLCSAAQILLTMLWLLAALVCSAAARERFLLYSVNAHEGFNLARDVYIRVVSLLDKLQACAIACSTWPMIAT